MIKHLILGVFLSFLACNNGPKVVPLQEGNPHAQLPEQGTRDPHQGLDLTTAGINEVFTDEPHLVYVLESLPTERYLYLKVKEKDEEYWIATDNKDAKVGGNYMFNEGVYQTNFESKEYNRIFDEIILVFNLLDTDKQHSEIRQETAEKRAQTPKLDQPIEAAPGVTRIAEIVDNPQSFSNKKVTVRAKCVKVNDNIMDRNWIHLMDGSKDDYDLVITSTESVDEGEIITMTGIVRLNKDFGSGYTYDIIIEEGEKLSQL